MIIIKAGRDLEESFSQMLKQFKRDIEWKGLFLINNNSIVLYGPKYSLCFNLDNKKLFMDVVRSEVKESMAIESYGNYQLTNAINIILYVFGKWNLLKGLNVQQKYDQLNAMFNRTFKNVGIEANLSDRNLKLFSNGLSITYEDALNKIINLTQNDKDEKNKEEQGKNSDIEIIRNKPSKSKVGLWHDMIWDLEKIQFGSEEIPPQPVRFGKKSRRGELGKNFTRIKHTCPACGDHLHMVVFPPKTDVPIKIDNDRIFMTRAFTCNTCKKYFTAKPEKLINEGEAYALDLSDDDHAYDDYFELLSERGYLGINSGFNEYESSRKRKSRNESENDELELQDEMDKIDEMPQEELSKVIGKMEEGFYPEKEVRKYKEETDRALRSKFERKMDKASEFSERELEAFKKHVEKELIFSPKEKKNYLDRIENFIIDKFYPNEKEKYKKEKRNEDEEELLAEAAELIENGENSENTGEKEDKSQNKDKTTNGNNEKNIKEENKKEKKKKTKKSKKEKNDEKEDKNSPETKSIFSGFKRNKKDKSDASYNDIENLNDSKEKTKNDEEYVYSTKELLDIAKSCDSKSFFQIKGIIDRLNKLKCKNDSAKDKIVDRLEEYLGKREKKEVDHILKSVPKELGKNDYKKFKNILELYNSEGEKAEKLLDKKYDIQERKEIGKIIKEENAKNRVSLHNLFTKLKTGNFEKRNIDPYLERIENRLEQADQELLKKIVPDISKLDFDDAVELHKKIAETIMLPKLKINILKELEDAISRIKVEENRLLVDKFKKELNQKANDLQNFFFYDSEKMYQKEPYDDESVIISNAQTSYGESCHEYEFPIVVHDPAKKPKGKKGFMLTEDQFIINTSFNKANYNVKDINDFDVRKNLLKSKLVVNHVKDGEVVVPTSLKDENMEGLKDQLNSFTDYLKEKPESRNIEYLKKRIHNEKICFRCGVHFMGEGACPNCGFINDQLET